MLVEWLYKEVLKDASVYKKIAVEVIATGWSWIMLLAFVRFQEYIFNGSRHLFSRSAPSISHCSSMGIFFLPAFAIRPKENVIVFVCHYCFWRSVSCCSLSSVQPEMKEYFFLLSFGCRLTISDLVLARFHFNQQQGKEKRYNHWRETVSQKAPISISAFADQSPFLFNALNTTYGTALQEKWIAMAEGVQKLGDMMRFMLQETRKKKIISLIRRSIHLTNGIDLQRLRTQPPRYSYRPNHKRQRLPSITSPHAAGSLCRNAFATACFVKKNHG